MGQIGKATTFITHTCIKAVLLEKKEFKAFFFISIFILLTHRKATEVLYIG